LGLCEDLLLDHVVLSSCNLEGPDRNEVCSLQCEEGYEKQDNGDVTNVECSAEQGDHEWIAVGVNATVEDFVCAEPVTTVHTVKGLYFVVFGQCQSEMFSGKA
jgi:hypothetical protein